MIDILNAANAEIATLAPIVAPPVPPYGYGRDLSCTDDLTPEFAEVDGPVLVLQSIYRELITPSGGPDAPGSLPDDTEYGLGVRQYVQRGSTPAELLRSAHEIEAHILRDDRVDTCSADVSLDSAYNLTVTVTGNLASSEGFILVFAVVDGAALLREISVNG